MKYNNLMLKIKKGYGNNNHRFLLFNDYHKYDYSELINYLEGYTDWDHDIIRFTFDAPTGASDEDIKQDVYRLFEDELKEATYDLVLNEFDNYYLVCDIRIDGIYIDRNDLLGPDDSECKCEFAVTYDLVGYDFDSADEEEEEED